MSQRRVSRHRPQFESLEDRVLFSRALGIDISDYQGTITAANWTSIKNSGRVFAITKASEGNNTTQSTYTNNMSRGKAAGVIMGMYHFADPYIAGHTGSTEAAHFLAIAGGDMDNGNLHPVLDVENTGGSTTSEGISLGDWVDEWCEYVYSHTGVKPMIYANSNYAQNFLTSSNASKWPLWIANYGSSDGAWNSTNVQTATLPTGGSGTGHWSTWQFWQYNSVSSIPGITGNVDADVANGDLSFVEGLEISGAQLTVTEAGNYIASGLSSATSFGTNTYHTTGTTLTFTVKNVGATTLNLASLTVPTGYVITNGLVASIAPGSSDTFKVQMDTNSTTITTKSGNITFTTNDPDAATFKIPITGTLTRTTPATPTNLQITSSTSSSVSLSWTDNATTESSYLVMRKIGAGSFSQIASLGANSNSYTDSTALPGTNYTYEVLANDGIGSSSPSNTVSLTTLATIPTNVAASDGTSDTAVHVTWTASTGASSYAIYRNSTNDSTTATQIGTASGTSYNDTTTPDDAVNYYWVQAVNSASQQSGFSNSDSGFIDVAPTVLSSSFNDDVLPQKVVVQFSKDVVGIVAGDLSVQDEDNLSNPAFAPDSVSYDADSHIATFNFDTQLPDANYRATITAGNVQDALAKTLPSDMTLDFSFLAGDGNHNGSVDIQDFNLLAANFGKTGQSFSQGNYDYSADGSVGLTDFNILASHFGHSLPPPPATGQSLTNQASSGTSAITSTAVTSTKTSSATTDDQLLTDSGLL